MPSLKSFFGYAACFVGLAAFAFADDWSNLATVSMTNATTPKLSNRYVCYTDGRDIRCDSPSLYVSTAGLVGINTTNPTTQLEVNGTVSATNFVGDGSGLTNLSVSGDRIVSGTLAAIANTGGYISLTTGGTTWGYVGSANSYLPNMGIGSAPVDTVLTVSGSDRVAFTGNAALQPLTLKGGGTLGNWRGIDFRTYGSWPIGRIGLQYTGSGSYLSFGTSNNYANGVTNQALTIDPQGRIGIGTNSPSTQLHISGSSIVTARIEGDLQGRLLVQTNNGAANQRIYEVMADIQGLKFSNINDAESVRSIFATFSPSGSLGIGKVTPIAKLDVSGTISASDAIQVGQSTLACSSPISGSIRYNTTSGTIQVCNGTGWVSLSSGTSAGVSSLAALTDTNITNLAGRDYLRYDAGTSKWVNISESTVMSTTTMVAGWPDAIRCNVTSPAWGQNIFYLSHSPSNINQYVYRMLFNTNSDPYLIFTSGGAYNSAGNLTTHDCNKSIAQLYASGQAFNFIGNTALGDRITSGTANVIANGGAGYVSLTSGATTWGYFGSGNSYLPMIQLGQPATACTIGISGSIRYNTTSDTLQVCTGSGWKSMVSGTAVSAMSALTDVQVTNIAGRDFLRYDAGTSKWVNISESTVMSTTTMSVNFPDAIQCAFTGNDTLPLTLYLGDVNAGGVGRRYYIYPGGTTYYAVFNADGSYNSGANQTSTGSYACANKSISQIYAAGRGFNSSNNLVENVIFVATLFATV